MSYKVVFNKRIWTRDLSDLEGGFMSSMHGHIKVDKENGQVRGEIMFRDCDNQISYDHWIEGKQKHTVKALKNLYKVREMLNQYIEKYEQICDDLTDLK